MTNTIKEFTDSRREEIIKEALKIAQISSPTGNEGKKAAYVKRKMQELGLQEVHIDSAGNVIGKLLPEKEKYIVIDAHIDTVFSDDVNLTFDVTKDTIIGPSIGDNSLAVAALLEAVSYFVQNPPKNYGMLFVASTGEEGLGNLKGIIQAVDDYKDKIHTVLVLEGGMNDMVVTGGVGSIRYKIKFFAEGGHSFGDFGKVSAIQVMAHVISEIYRWDVPSDPKTTYNVGIVEGGRSINTISPYAGLLLDMRSTDEKELKALDERLEKLLSQAKSQYPIKIETTLLGKRPAGNLPSDSPLIEKILQIRDALGLETKLDYASTNANYPMSLGIPAMCLGIAYGGKAHTIDEYIKIEGIQEGLQQVLLMAKTIDEEL